MPWFFFTQKNQSNFQYTMKMHKNLGPITCDFILHQMILRVRDPILAKQVLNDTDIFEHDMMDFLKYFNDFIGKQHLLGVNNPVWKRQRKILDPTFKALHRYFQIFSDKTELVLDEMIEKRGFLVEYVLVYSQSMALDILGLSIFGYDFKSLTNENGENLKSF
jgi:cytochrome P450 family 97 subfamily B polypeptide 3